MEIIVMTINFRGEKWFRLIVRDILFGHKWACCKEYPPNISIFEAIEDFEIVYKKLRAVDNNRLVKTVLE